MKKIFAILLCALLTVCAVVPAFAAQLTEREPTDPFVEAEITKVKFSDYTDVQPDLFDNTEYWAEHNGPDWGKAGFSGAKGADYLTFWGSNGFNGTDDLWGEKTYQVPFTAPVDGTYSFAVDICSGGDAGGIVPVRVDDGETYELVINGRYTVDGDGKTAPVTYYGMDEIYLEAGEHVFHIAKMLPKAEDKTQYYFGFQYTYIADEDAAGDDSSDDAGEPTLPAGVFLEDPFADAYYVAKTYLNTEENTKRNGTASTDTYYTLSPTDSSWATIDGIRANGDFSFQFDIVVEKTATYDIGMIAEHFLSSTDKISTEPMDLYLDGKLYTMTPDLDWRGIYYYIVGEDVVLEEGTYTATLSRNWSEEQGYYRSSSVNSIVLAINDEADLGGGASGGDDAAPETFDAGILALVVAGVSAAGAVVLKKRR